jgi:hypothetical protein
MINSVGSLLFYFLATILIIFYSLIIKMTVKVMPKQQQEKLEKIGLINMNEEEILENKSLMKTKKSLKYTKGLFIIVLIFVSTVIPFGTVSLVNEFHKLPRFFHMYSFLLIRLCSVFNPLFYGLYNSSFMFGYKNVIHIILHRKKLNFEIYKNDRAYKLAVKNKKKINKRKEQNVAQERSWNQRKKKK